LVPLLAPSSLCGTAAASLVISFNIVTEFWVADQLTWHQIRGAVMVLSMKIISIGFDYDHDIMKRKTKDTTIENDAKDDDGEKELAKVKEKGGRRRRRNKKTEDDKVKRSDSNSENAAPEMPGVLEYLGYCFCPASVVLGPWVPLAEYRAIFIDSRWNLTWAVKVLTCSVFSLLFLSLSTCWTPWLLSSPSSPWLEAYREALSFRASHYFVSFTSEACLIAAGFGAQVVGGRQVWFYTVTQPNNVEVPRSLVEVVVGWHVPMHTWLKRYVFRPVRQKLGPGCAVFATYLASTVLHGLSAQLALTLLSLGLYTWVEHRLRDKLANSLGASIGSRSGRDSGLFKHDENEWWVIIINLMFGLLTLFHLTYLGVMFDQSDQHLQQTGYSWQHTLDKWRKLDFASHWIVAGMYTINFLI